MELIEKTISLYKNIQDVFNKLSLDDKKEDEEEQAQLTLLNNALQSIYNDFLEKTEGEKEDVSFALEFVKLLISSPHITYFYEEDRIISDILSLYLQITSNLQQMDNVYSIDFTTKNNDKIHVNIKPINSINEKLKAKTFFQLSKNLIEAIYYDTTETQIDTSRIDSSYEDIKNNITFPDIEGQITKLTNISLLILANIIIDVELNISNSILLNVKKKKSELDNSLKDILEKTKNPETANTLYNKSLSQLLNTYLTLEDFNTLIIAYDICSASNNVFLNKNYQDYSLKEIIFLLLCK